jgi:SAM-dependent methyltransferase
MGSVSQRTTEAGAGASAFCGQSAAAGVCPSCGQGVEQLSSCEKYGRYELWACGACGLHFWDPRQMPDASWYEQMYGGRDEQLLPLEPGHKYFLSDASAPGKGELLDIGCGTGNFLAAARKAGYQVTGTELDRNAARFAKERLGLERVLPLTVVEFAKQYPTEKFDCVTFFEVLEHQALPLEFIKSVKACLRPRGYVALSVPNRARWMTGPDVFDYPPNHFLRWSAAALKTFLHAQGFEVLSVREQPVGISYASRMINMALRTGISKHALGEASTSFRDVMQMPKEQAAAILSAKVSGRQRVMQWLGKTKQWACVPLGVAALPYLRIRGYKGTYLYCLARLHD